MKIKKKLLLISFVLPGLLSIVLWSYGWRVGHLKLLFFEPMELSAEEKAQVYGWLKENAIALDTIEAGSGFDDMEPLKAMIGDARIVSLGEAAHLNRDFSRAKHTLQETELWKPLWPRQGLILPLLIFAHCQKVLSPGTSTRQFAQEVLKLYIHYHMMQCCSSNQRLMHVLSKKGFWELPKHFQPRTILTLRKSKKGS